MNMRHPEVYHPPSAWLRFACVIAHADLELLAQSNALDRMTVGASAIVLIVIFALALVAWSGFFLTFMAVPLALLCALIVATLIAMLDRAFAAADWSLAGVLRTPGREGGRAVKLVVRLTIAFVLSFATARSATLAVAHDETAALLKAEAATANAPIRLDYEARAKAAQAQLVGPLEAELAALSEERGRILRAITDREAAINKAHDTANLGRVEADRERVGDKAGYQRGEGPRYAEANRLTEAASRLTAESAADVERQRQRLAAIAPQVEHKAAELRAQAVQVAAAEAQAREQMTMDPRWQGERRSPLSHFAALTKLKADPVLGPEVKWFEIEIQLALLVMELSVFALKLWGTHASIYVLMLIRRTKEQAAEQGLALASRLRELRRQHARGQGGSGLRGPQDGDGDGPPADRMH